MRAIGILRYGGPEVLVMEERPVPEPGPGEVRLKVHAASLNAADWHLIRADPFFVRFMFGLSRPKQIKGPGADVAGVVDKVGPGVSRLKVGDAVFGNVFQSGMGAAAEYLCAKEVSFALKPENLSFDEAATIPLAGETALIGLREVCAVKACDEVLIQGASGGVGIFAIQIAKALGARVTAVCSTTKMEQARALGADQVIDYKTENFTTRAERYDAILACNGYNPIRRYRDCLKPGGRYGMVGGTYKQMFETAALGPWLGKDGKKFVMVDARHTLERIETLAAMARDGKLRTVIDRRFSLEQTPEAFAYVEAGRASGKIVIRVV